MPIAGSEVRHTHHLAEPWERIGKMRTTFELTIDLKEVEKTKSKWFAWAPYIYLPLNSIIKTTEEQDTDYRNMLWNKASGVLQESQERFSKIQSGKTVEAYKLGRPFGQIPTEELQKVAHSEFVEVPSPEPDITAREALQAKIHTAMQDRNMDEVRKLMAERAALATSSTVPDIQSRIQQMNQTQLIDFIVENQSDDTCTICGEVITDPFVTPCGHIFCLGCIEEYSEKEATPPKSFADPEVPSLAIMGGMTCPLCRQEFKLPQFGEAPQVNPENPAPPPRPWHGGCLGCSPGEPIPHDTHRVLLASGRLSWTEKYGIYFKNVKNTEIKSGSDPRVAPEGGGTLNRDMTISGGFGIAGAGGAAGGAAGGTELGSSVEVIGSSIEVSARSGDR